MRHGVVARLAREWGVAKAMAPLLLQRVEFGRRPAVVGMRPYISNEGTITIGSRVVFGGEGAKVLLRTHGDGRISIGNEVLVNSGASIQSADSVTIGNYCRIGPRASISDTDFHEVEPGAGVKCVPVVIGHDVWIGQNAVILPGVVVGDGAVVGANSVVSRSVDPWCVVAGSPARVVRRLAEGERRRK